MIDGNTKDFLDKLFYEDHYVVYEGEKYFLNGCQTTYNDDKSESVRLEVYNLSKNITVFSVTKPTAIECVESFQEAKIWNRKDFWEAENIMVWVDD